MPLAESMRAERASGPGLRIGLTKRAKRVKNFQICGDLLHPSVYSDGLTKPRALRLLKALSNTIKVNDLLIG